MRVFFTGLEQLAYILGHLGARLFDPDSGTAVHQQRISLHDAVDGGFHGILLVSVQANSVSKRAIAWLARRIRLHSPRWNSRTMISSSVSLLTMMSGMAPVF